MYQFSPELYLSCFNGYRNLDKFNSTLETYIIIIARKISNERELLLKNCPNQYSYDEHDWKK